jgi:plastocyanin
MTRAILGAAVSVLVGLCMSSAADIQGSIIIRHKLTKRRVTATAGAYDRGIAVPLGADPVVNPLDFERIRVAIYIDGEAAQPEHAAPTVIIEQKNRQFVPDLLVVPVGSTVSFPNLDPIFHNVFSLSKPKSFDLGNYPKGQSRDVTFSKPGIVLLNCRLHTNMAASIVVTPNGWSARSDASGRFVLRNVPAGKHIVVAWHKSAGFFRKTVSVTDLHDATVSFEIPLDENGAPTAPAVAQK